jgi:hypothetical protein
MGETYPTELENATIVPVARGGDIGRNVSSESCVSIRGMGLRRVAQPFSLVGINNQSGCPALAFCARAGTTDACSDAFRGARSRSVIFVRRSFNLKCRWCLLHLRCIPLSTINPTIFGSIVPALAQNARTGHPTMLMMSARSKVPGHPAKAHAVMMNGFFGDNESQPFV